MVVLRSTVILYGCLAYDSVLFAAEILLLLQSFVVVQFELNKNMYIRLSITANSLIYNVLENSFKVGRSSNFKSTFATVNKLLFLQIS